MKKFIFSYLWFAFLFIPGIYSQSCQINGTVKSTSGDPIAFAAVKEKNTNNQVITDWEGFFTIEVSHCDSCVLMFSYVGFENKEITTKGGTHIDVIMIPAETTTGGHPPIDYPTEEVTQVTGSLLIDVTFLDFNEFSDYLGEENIDFLNRSNVILGFGLELSKKNFLGSFQFGFGGTEEQEPDSVATDVNNTYYALHFGYYLFTSDHFYLAPEIALKWYRYRLMNFNKDRKVDLDDYLKNRELDIRINQLTGYAGIRMYFKFNFLSVGGYCGYITKLSNEPWIRSATSRLETDQSIVFENINFGVTFSFHSF